MAGLLDFFALEIWPNSGSTVNFSSQSLINNSTIIGTGGGNTLIGPLLAGGQMWRIDGLDSGLMRLPNSKLLRWVNMQTLVGNDSDDTFQFTGGSVSGSLDGGIGHNTLFYNPPPTPFVVDLPNGIAPLVGGSVSNIQSVITDTTGLPTLSINNVALAEGNTGTTKLVFTVTLSSNPTAAGAGDGEHRRRHGDAGRQRLSSDHQLGARIQPRWSANAIRHRAHQRRLAE